MKIKVICLILSCFFIHSCGTGDGGSDITPKIAWSASGDQGAQSATFYVPMDSSHDDATRLALALKRLTRSSKTV